MPAPSLCAVSGVVYDENGVPAVGVTIYLKRVLLNGVLIGTAPIGTVSIPQLAGGDHTIQYIEAITSIAGGVVSFTVPQLSTVYLEGNVSGYNNGEVALSIPATATSTLEALSPATFPIDVTTFTFLSLVDTPDDFTGQALKNVRVNAAGTALEFSAPVVVDNETVQDALVNFFPDVAPFDWTYDDAGDRVTLAILDATSGARGLMSTAYAARLDQLEVGDSPTFAGFLLNGVTPQLSLGATSQAGRIEFRRASDGAAQSYIGFSGPTESATILLIAGGGSGALQLQASQTVKITSGNTFTALFADAAGLVGINKSTGLTAQLHTLSNAIGVIPLIAEGPAGQTANLQEWRVNGSAVCTLASTGSITTSGSLITTGNSIIGRGSLAAFNNNTNFALANSFVMAWNAAATYNGGAFDTSLSRQAAGIVQVGTGTGNALGKLDCAEYRIAGTKVVGAQGAAVIDATDNPSAITQLNALLARLRAHGLIAT